MARSYKNGQKWTEINGNGENCLKLLEWLEKAGHGWKELYMSGKGWNLLEKNWTLQKMAVNNWE